MAISRRLTAGDDNFVAPPTFDDGEAWVGLYAVPMSRVEPGEAARIMTATGNTAVARRLTGPSGTDWSWLPNGAPTLRAGEIADAQAAVDAPARAVDGGGPIVGAETAGGLADVLDATATIVGAAADGVASRHQPPTAYGA